MEIICYCLGLSGLIPNNCPTTMIYKIIYHSETMQTKVTLSCTNSLTLHVYSTNAGKASYALVNRVCHCLYIIKLMIYISTKTAASASRRIRHYFKYNLAIRGGWCAPRLAMTIFANFELRVQSYYIGTKSFCVTVKNIKNSFFFHFFPKKSNYFCRTQKDCIQYMYLCTRKQKEAWLSGRKRHTANVLSQMAPEVRILLLPQMVR